MAIEIFNRYENKYIISQQQYEQLLSILSQKMKPDKHNQNGKMYKIYNTYYDTPDNNIIRTSLEKPAFREKIRIRAYKIVKPDDTVYVEIKRKYDGRVSKRRTAMTFTEAKHFLSGAKITPPARTDPQVIRELTEIIHRQPLAPKVHISYERMALISRQDSDLRISFDHNIAVRRRHVTLDHNEAGQRLLPSDKYLMEIKVNQVMPLWLVKIINNTQLKPISFSKYGKEYLKTLKENYV